jgi:hypothetical protein
VLAILFPIFALYASIATGYDVYNVDRNKIIALALSLSLETISIKPFTDAGFHGCSRPLAPVLQPWAFKKMAVSELAPIRITGILPVRSIVPEPSRVEIIIGNETPLNL